MRKQFEDTRVFMNTQINIKLIGDIGTVESYKIFDEAFGEFDYVVKKFSRFDENSELSEINRNNNQWQKVSDEYLLLLKTGLEIAHDTDGAFDPTVIDLLEKWGYTKEKNINTELKDEEMIEFAKQRKNYSAIQINEQTNSVNLNGTRIDFGNIGKGYAIDKAAKVLNKYGDYCISAGGDIYAKGKNIEGNIWTAGLSIPGDINSIFGKVRLDRMSLTGSGTWAIKSGKFNHILNPKTGLPINYIIQSFVLNKSAMMADAYATMLIVSLEQGLTYLEKSQVGGMIVLDGKVFFNDYFDYEN